MNYRLEPLVNHFVDNDRCSLNQIKKKSQLGKEFSAKKYSNENFFALKNGFEKMENIPLHDESFCSS
jgi:hypothetical protein